MVRKSVQRIFLKLLLNFKKPNKIEAMTVHQTKLNMKERKKNAFANWENHENIYREL
jgi:hypothetical protein